jgi:murein DD-endopeptidase MepM/ murein hydrolase activator NlpD
MIIIMAKKWVIRAIAILMALIMALSVLYVVIGSITAEAVVTQSQIDKLRIQQKEYEKKKQELQSQINSLQYQQSTALQKKKVLDDQILLTQQEIDNITEMITQYDELIVQKTVELQNAQTNEDAQMEKYKSHMRSMEENGAITYISVIFQASSFADLIARINDVGEIMQFEQDLFERLEAAKQATIDTKNALQVAKTDQEADKVDLETKRTDLQNQMDDANTLLAQLENDIGAAKELYEQEKKDAAAIQAEINKKSEELKKTQQHSSAVKGTGTLIWPTPSCNIVNSTFGMRYHPIYHEYRMHTGVDIRASYGANIDAADDGTVIISVYSSSYGNYVVVDHGNGTTTTYAHMSKRLVKVGDKVKQGQVIGLVGSTGNSTGAHLHFEVSVNGTRKNPLSYYDSTTYVIL